MIHSREELGKAKKRMLWKLCAVVSVAFLFGNYYYLYFVDFDQGAVSGYPYAVFLKLFSLVLFYLVFFDLKLKLKFDLREQIFFVLVFFSATFFFLKRYFIGVGSDLYLNFLLCSLPFLLSSFRFDKSSVLFFFESCLYVSFFQIILDFLIKRWGLSLWDNDAFVGGLGNPSSFGIFCNVLLSYVLFARARGLSSFLFVCLLSYAIVNTKSLFSIMALGMIFIYYAWSKGRIFGVAWVLVFAFIFIAFNNFFGFDHLSYKLNSLYEAFSDPLNVGSKSVSVRIDIHQEFLERLSDHAVWVFFFGYHDFYYYYVDSQVLSFVGSFGLLFCVLFFASVSSFFFGPRFFSDISKFFKISIFIFIIMLATNRILDYFPMTILFLMLVFGFNKFRQ